MTFDLATDVVNHTSAGTSRITGLFKDAPKFKAFVAAALAPFDEIEACYQSDDPINFSFAMLTDLFTQVVLSAADWTSSFAISRTRYNNETVTNTAKISTGFVASTINGVSAPRVRGVHLDRLGVILGVSRAVASQGQTVILVEKDYATVLRAKVARNNYTGLWDGPNGLLAALALIFSIGGAIPVRVFQVSAMALIFTIGRTLSSVETAIIRNFTNFLPINQGVGIDTFITYPSDYYGFQEDASADGCAENLPGGFISTNGGSLAENVI